MPARWKFCIAYVNGNLGMSVGSLFVREFFDGQSKQDMLYLTAEIQVDDSDAKSDNADTLGPVWCLAAGGGLAFTDDEEHGQVSQKCA